MATDGVKCNICGKGPMTEHGLKCHMSTIHDDQSLNGKTKQCDWCGTDVTRSPAQFINQRTGKPYEQVFCSKSCEGSWSKENRTGEKAGGWNGGKTNVICDYCDDTFSVKPSRAKKHKRHFCNKDCESRWRSENIVGEAHHRWKGGEYQSYGQGWSRCRRQARRRDNYTCQDCGIKEENLDHELDVHHIKLVREFNNPSDAHFLDNVVTLCRSCHRLRHSQK